MLVNVVVGFLLEKMVVDAYGDLPQILQREKQRMNAEKFQQRRKRDKEERFQNMLEATMKRVLHGQSDGPPAPSELKRNRPVSQLYSEMSQLSARFEQVSNFSMTTLSPDQLMGLVQVTYVRFLTSPNIRA